MEFIVENTIANVVIKRHFTFCTLAKRMTLLLDSN